MSNLFPDEYVHSSYEIDYEELYKQGYRGIIYDVDNTLVPHGAPADERAIALFKRLKAIGFECCLLSNNGEARVKMFNDDVHVKYVYKANKPKASGYQKAMKLMGTDKDHTIFIGDQIFTDIWGANRAGIRNYMVEYINPKEEIQIVLKRLLEKVVLFFYRRRNRMKNRHGGRDNGK